jgi:hypothetical protein
VESVATLPWNQWQDCSGISGNFGVEYAVLVTCRALRARINRKLAKQQHKLCGAQGLYTRHQLGDFYITTADQRTIVARHCALVQLGRELGVLKPWEAMEEPTHV